MIKNEIEKTEILSPREELFCSNFCSVGSDTFSQKEKSAIQAGYSKGSAKNIATKLLKRPDIVERIQELHSQNMSRNNINVDSVLANISHDRELARAKGDFSSALRADELLGKYLSLFHADKMSITLPMVKLQTEEQQKRTEELTLMLEQAINAKYNTVQLENVTEQKEISAGSIPTFPQPPAAVKQERPLLQRGQF
jgi:hypothetical protein